jgi:hypothetical protein
MTEAMAIVGIKTGRNSRGLDPHSSRWSLPCGAQWLRLRGLPASHAQAGEIFLSPDRDRPMPTIGGIGATRSPAMLGNRPDCPRLIRGGGFPMRGEAGGSLYRILATTGPSYATAGVAFAP